MKKQLFGAALAAVALLCALQVNAADNYAVKDGSGASITLKAKEVGGVKVVTHTVANSDGTTLIDPATAANQATLNGYVDGLETAIASTNTKIDSVITYIDGLETVLGTVTASPTSNTIADRLKVITTTLGSPFQSGGSIGNTAFGATQSGTWNITNISGTVSLPTGAATAANQSTTNGYLASLAGAVSSTNLNVICTSGCSGGGGSGYSVLNASTYANSSSYSNVPSGGLVSTSAPTFTTGQASPLSLTTAGALRVDGSAVTQPVSGSLTNISGTISLPTGAATSANQSTLNGYVDGVETLIGTTNSTLTTIDGRVDGLEALVTSTNGYVDGIEGSLATLTGTVSAGNINVVCTSGCSGGGGGGEVTNAGTFAVQNTAATPAGTNLIGKVGLDQTTPGTTNGVVVNSSALPTGAATAAKQPALGTAGTASSDVITVQGIAGGTPLIAATTVANPTSTITHPGSGATAYAAGDVFSNNATAGSVTWPSLTVTRVAAGSVKLNRFRLNASTTSGWGGVNFAVDLWSTTAPTLTNGNNGIYAVATGAANYIGTVTFSLQQFADGAVGTGILADGPLNLKLASGSVIYWTPQILSAATPVNSMTLTLTAEVEQN